MFTGIIEEVGRVKTLNKSAQGAVIEVQCQTILESVKVGDSVAVDGACLTVISLNKTSFKADISLETLTKTILKDKISGSLVNLERALRVGDRLGGHMVSGHIDCTGILSAKKSSGNGFVCEFSYPENFRPYLIEKGSVSINGISLTVVDVLQSKFSVWVIPHTFANTSLSDVNIGGSINLEFDMLAKYIENFVRLKNTAQGLNIQTLSENGYL